MAETEIHEGITADGLAGLFGEWVVIDKIRRGMQKIIFIYQRRKMGLAGHSRIWLWQDDYKVQIVQNEIERWERFNSIYDVRDYLEKINKGIVWKGKVFNDRSSFLVEHWKGRYNSGSIKFSLDDLERAIGSVASGLSCNEASKKYGINVLTLAKHLRKNGYIFVPNTPNSCYGKWIKGNS